MQTLKNSLVILGYFLWLLSMLTPQAMATEYLMDQADSRLEFSAEQQGAAFRGRFENFSASLIIDSKQAEKNRLEAQIDMASVNTDYAERDDYLVGEEWFDVARWPRAKFSASGFTAHADNRYSADGLLSLRGVERPLSLEFDFDGRRLTGKASIDRREFGVGQGMWADDRMVGAEVVIHVDVLFRAQE